MPRRYNRKRTYKPRYKKRSYKRRTTYRKGSKKMVRSGQVSHRIIKFVFADNTHLYMEYIPTDTLHFYQYKLNSAWDPTTITANVGLPGFAQWSAFYKRYRVLGARYTVEFINTGSFPMYAGFYTKPGDTAAPTTWLQWKATAGLPYCKQTLLSPAGTTGAKQTLSVYVNIAKFFGNKLSVMADDSFEAEVTADPVSLVNGMVYTLTGNGVAGGLGVTSVVYTRCNITYFVKMYDKADIIPTDIEAELQDERMLEGLSLSSSFGSSVSSVSNSSFFGNK